MKLVISNESDKNIPRTHLEQVAKRMQIYLVKKGVSKSELQKEVVVVFLPTAHAKALNFQFRKKDYATDVLSFHSADPECLGELVMCPEVLERQAEENGHSFKWEVTYMFIHGVLHLLGYDHEKSSRQAQKMFRLQDDFFSLLKPSV